MKTKILTKQPGGGLFLPITNAATPEQLDQTAAQLEASARALRAAAKSLRDGPVVARKFPGESTVLMAQVITPPGVITTAEIALKRTGTPMHIDELVEAVRAGGAFIKNRAILASMLSKNKRRTFRPVVGRQGYWELVTNTSSTGS